MNRVEKLRRIAENQSLIYNSGYMSGMSKSVGGIQFTSDRSEILIRYSSNGTVKFYANDNLIEQIDTNVGLASIVLQAGQDSDNSYRIEGIENILTLDISGQGIRTLVVNSYTALTKLVIYDNNIIKLDLSNCPELRYLHFHNNPICDEDAYYANLIECVRSLPDRTGKALGSIVMYPWYGLETLICDDNGTYRKYPIGTYSHYDGSTKNDMNNSKTVSIVDGKLYGVVNGDSISYGTGNGTEVVPHTAMNRHHTIRKNLEKSYTLSKNWMFGSAIQYHDDYKYCYHYFRDIGVQDVWETAEKGFGVCIGSIDNYNGRVNDWDDMNIKAFLDNNGNESSPSGDSSEHGDTILSHIAGRGGLSPYGICPNASFLVMGPLSVNDNAMKLLTMPGNCDSLTFSYGYTEDSDKCARRYYLGEFGKNGIITESAGNDGDGLPWTMDASYKMSGFGDFGDSASDTKKAVPLQIDY